jgi:hypothetical protein
MHYIVWFEAFHDERRLRMEANGKFFCATKTVLENLRLGNYFLHGSE